MNVVLRIVVEFRRHLRPYLRPVRGVVLAFVLAAALPDLRPQSSAIPESELGYAPTPARLAALHAAARRDGWNPVAAAARQAALRAYGVDKTQAAEAWLNVHRWARVFGQTAAEFVPAWVAAVNAAQVGHRNMAPPENPGAEPLGAAVAPELQAWLMAQADFSAEFFGLLQPVDYLPRVLAILDELHRADRTKFRSHAALALAIAVVYDVAPPPFWPHAQVAPAALPRRLPEPREAFAWWTKQEQAGRLYHRLARLGADELKFVVDTPAPWEELEWAQRSVNLALPQLAQAYSSIRYHRERAVAGLHLWSGPSYRLEDIRRTGGICADQAYFATQVGKARGVPTLLFHGPGNDGRHAWFGFLDGNRQWQLDAGRYAEQRFVTGYARDPQTWREFTDHELQFLAERFRELPAYRQSRVHAAFAAEFLADGQPARAAAGARRAVSFERRNRAGWETLLAAAAAENKDAKTVEGLLREAALAFQRYPDLAADYTNRVAASLRARGQTSAAEHEVRAVALKGQRTGRGDLSTAQARDMLRRALGTQPLAEQVRTYNSVLDTYGRGAGIGFFDAIVTGFVEHLLRLGHRDEARRAVERAGRTLKVEPGSQLAAELERLAADVRSAK